MLLALRNHNGSVSCRKDGYLFVLSRRAAARVPVDGTEVECMIVAALGTHPKGLTVEPVTPDHVLVQHRGFECIGTMCSTTASTIDPRDGIGWLTPGRVQDLIHVAHNVNAAWRESGMQPKKPGRAYVLRGERRLAGLPDVADVDAAAWEQVVAWNRRMRDMRETAQATA